MHPPSEADLADAIATAKGLASLIATNPDQGLAMAFTVVILAGVLQISFGIFKIGHFVTLMPYTVVSGFMSGIGLIFIILQIGPFRRKI